MSAAFVIAIDGPAASGKGTLARRLAKRFGLAHLDSGMLYRAVGRDVVAKGGELGDPEAATAAASTLDPATLGDPGLRDEAAGRAASVVAAYPGVRAALLDFQRNFAGTPPGAVIDGRDIGTVVCPDAPAKLFVTASVEARAERRVKELTGRGERISYEAVLADLRARDERDSSRSAAPLKQAEDAVLLDTTHMGVDDAFAAAEAVVLARQSAGN